MNEYSIGVLDDGINGFLDKWVQGVDHRLVPIIGWCRSSTVTLGAGVGSTFENFL
jgi:hypothetical protein